MLQYVIVPVTEYQQNCALFYDDESRQAVIVDPGGDVPLIEQKVAELDLKVQAIWLTHGHLDHAGGAMAAKSAFGVKIVGPHQADKMLLDHIEQTCAAYGLSGMQNATPDRWLNEGDVLELDSHQFEILHCPGHAPGHVIFVNHATKFIIMGDVLFEGSVGRTDLPGGDYSTLMTSIRDKVLPLGDDYQFLCGHGPGSTIGREKQSNPFIQPLLE